MTLTRTPDPPHERPMPNGKKIRTPLRNVTGQERHVGDPRLAARLADALRVSEADARLVTLGLHAVHPFPGRLHPAWVRRLFADAPAGARVYDPFCGGGTVLVEARRAGLAAEGSDLHPLAVRLSRLKAGGAPEPTAGAKEPVSTAAPGPTDRAAGTAGGPPPDLALLDAEAARCADASKRRRDTPFSRLAQGERAFLPHVLATLIALRDEVERTADPHVREVLLFSLTPLLDKFSARPGRAPVATSAHAVRDHFRERAARWRAFFEELAGAPPATVHAADARRMPLARASVDLLVTSPPYPGVYDYSAAQARWATWLGIRPPRRAQGGELGRAPTREAWLSDLRAVLEGTARVLRPGGSAFFFLADGVLERDAARVDEELEHLTRRGPLEVVAAASQERPHFHGPTADVFANRPRREHLFLFQKRERSRAR